MKNLRAYKQFEVLQNTLLVKEEAIQKAQKQLEMLNMSTMKYQNAVVAVVNLQTAGFSDKQIMELTKVVEMWNQNQPPGMNQGNGGGGNGNNSFKWDTELNLRNK